MAKSISVCCCPLVLWIAAFAQPAKPQDRPLKGGEHATDEEKHVLAILAARDATQAAENYRALFKQVGPDGLRRLQSHRNDRIAVQAAWEEVELTVPEKPERTVRPDRDKLAWFVGFLEGRVRVRAPQWWAEALLDARANRRGNVYPGGLNMSESKATPPPTAVFESQNDKPVIRVGTESVAIPADFRDRVKTGGLRTRVTSLITLAQYYVAVHEDVGYPYQLACVDRSSVKVRWVADVWASWWGAASGVHRQWVEVTEQGK